MTTIRLLGCLLAAGAVLGNLTGCAPHDHATDEQAGHDHEEPRSAQITVFGERYEVFAEHLPAVAGAPTKFLAHVTDLKTSEPRREGPIRFQLRQGQEAAIEHVENAPSRPGIYEPKLTFPKAGSWSVTVMIPAEQGEEAIAFPPVEVYPTAHDADHAEVPAAPEGVTFLKEQQWKLLAGTQKVAKRRLIERVRLPAQVVARPGSLAQITPPIAGRLIPPPGRAMPMVGDKVAAGEVVAQVQPVFSEFAVRMVEAEAEAVRAELELAQAERALQRMEKLVKAEAKSERELQEAEFARKTALARHTAALALQATYKQAGTNFGAQGAGGLPSVDLRSPIAGTLIQQSGAAVGEYVTAERAQFTVLDAGTVFIEAQVPEADLKRVGATRAAAYELAGETGSSTPITTDGAGRFVFLGLRVDPATRAVPLVYEVRNANSRLRVGQAVTLEVETDHAEQALAVPIAAVVEEAGRPIVFVQLGGETFQKRDVSLGIRDGSWVQVLSGLAEGERVVTRGAYAVRLASVSSAIPSHGHAH